MVAEPGFPGYDLIMRSTHRLLILSAALLFSTGGAAVKACALSSFQIASFRSGIAFLVLILLIPSARRAWTWKTWLVGLAYAGTMLLYVAANKLTTAANTIFLQDTAPLYILMLSPLLLKEKHHKGDLSFMILMFSGVLMFFIGHPHPAATAPDPFTGNLLALAAGICWALTLMGIRGLGRNTGSHASTAAVAVGNLLACLLVLPFALPIPNARPEDWMIIAFLGIFQIALAYVFLTRGMQKVPALESSLLLLTEPVLNPIWAFLIHGEKPGPWAILGGAIVLGATTFRTLRGNRHREA